MKSKSLSVPDRPENASRLINSIIDHGLTGALITIDEIVRALRGLTRKETDWLAYLDRARAVVFNHEPILARTLTDSLLASWLTGAAKPLTRLPEPPPVLKTEEPTFLRIARIEPPELLPPFNGQTPPGEPPPIVRFPRIEEAARNLAERRVMTRAEFDELARQAKASAFTVSRVSSEATLEKIQKALVEDVRRGGTLREFKARLDEVVRGTPLSPAHVENVYRTNVGTAYAAGLDEILSHPLVADEFPYLAYHAVHDSRTRLEHLKMERLGIGYSNVYRRDDPIWDLFTPPWDFNCRCAVIPLTLEDAAGMGVREARDWLRTGVAPRNPAWVRMPPFSPPPGWATRRRLAAVI